VRLAEPSDLPAIVEIYNAAIPGRMATADLEPVTLESRRAWFATHSPTRRPLWVDERGGTLAGWVSLSDFYGRPAYARTAEVSVYVAAPWRRHGVGAGLLAHALATSPALEISTLLAFVFAHNAPSLALFERFGFRRSGLLSGVAALDGVERDLAILARRVAAP
jgi:phosphinothricin acetyltransferase